MMGNEEEREYGPGGSVHEWRAGWRRTSWGAIFAGAFVTMTIFILLQLLGAGIGVLSLNLTGGRTTSPTSLGIVAAIWWFITGLIALFIGGWVAGRLGWRAAKVDRALHGLTMWAVFYVALFLMVSTALGALVGGGISLLGSSASAAGQAASTPQGQQAIQQTGEQAANITGGTLIGLALAMFIGAIVAILGSLAAVTPPYVPPYEREREVAKARERTYAGTR